MSVVLRSVQTQVVALESLISCSRRLCTLCMACALHVSFDYWPHVITNMLVQL